MAQNDPPLVSTPGQRQHHGGGLPTLWFETFCVLAAIGLICAHFFALWQLRGIWTWWMAVGIFAAWPAADLVSGLVHWLADTWGSEDFPILGPRFIRPFRVHHVSPTSFLDCNFFDTNGDTCLISIPILASLWLLPINSTWGLVALTFGVFFCVFAIPTNQIHQWAHSSSPPRWVKWLQRAGIILSREEHARHHFQPFDGHYCITTGFCNYGLEKVGFFRGLEYLITSATGFLPRVDEQRHIKGEHSIDSTPEL